jgi:endonuclease/exonuclease/phosphatase family metal-dependent hydrolase
MKLLSLNIWGGRLYEPLINFLKLNKNEIDIFCFQEVFKSEKNIFSNGSKMNMYFDLQNLLNDYQIFYSPTLENRDLKQEVNFKVSFGNAIFVKKGIKIVKEGSIFIHGAYNKTKKLFDESYGTYFNFPRTLQYVILENGLMVINIHGFWTLKTKNDTPESKAQAKKIIKFLSNFENKKIICGDFNLNPDTKSILLLEEHLLNLIKDYKIKTTRNKYYEGKEKYADYIFVSNEINVLDFEVIDQEVSDHLPLLLEFK